MERAVGLERWTRRVLPRGGALPEDMWEDRHRAVLIVLWLHVLGIPIFSLFVGRTFAHGLVDTTPVALLAASASLRSASGRRARAVIASLGLLTASAVLVHLAGGATEMHFHFFVMIGLIALYQDWVPLLASIAFVALHHAVIGILTPHDVYDHPQASARPIVWAMVHAVFVLAASAVQITNWRVTEGQHDRSERRLAHQALHDGLTSLPNRALLTNRIEHALDRPDDDLVTALVYIDLDDFKTLNDALGQSTGDEVLVEMARRIAGCLSPGDTCARLGGDEFGVLLEDRPGPEAAYDMATRILEAVHGDMNAAGSLVQAEASVGIAYHRAGDDADDLVRNADLAMEEAKALGKGGIELFHDGMRQAVLDRLATKVDMRRALGAEEFVPYYQPIVSLATGQVVGAEALVRWRHPERGILAPAAFLEQAEESGLIIDIGTGVLTRACADAVTWPDGPSGPITLSVNLSARQLQQEGLVNTVAGVLCGTGLLASRLTLEITENVLVDDPAAAARVLGELKVLGVSIALDDFGTGYSSLSYLSRFPVDCLKIDKTFVDALDASEGTEQVLLQAIVGLGRTLELTVVAEGIERPEQWVGLRALGCGLGQGYLFARPMSHEDFLVFDPTALQPV